MNLVLILFWMQLVHADSFHFESKIKNCTKSSLDNILLDVDKSISNKLEPLNDSQRELFFYKYTTDSDLVGLIGSRFFPKNKNLSRAVKACGYHMDLYIQSLKSKNRNSDEFQNWISCMNNDYKNNIPLVAKKIIKCSKTY